MVNNRNFIKRAIITQNFNTFTEIMDNCAEDAKKENNGGQKLGHKDLPN